MTDYPQNVPFLEASNIISAIRSGSIVENRAQFAHSIWVIQGYAQSYVFGDGNTIKMSAAIVGDVSDMDALVELQKVSQLGNEEGISPQIAINWKAILIWVLKTAASEILKNAL